jgi:hypothetical protein
MSGNDKKRFIKKWMVLLQLAKNSCFSVSRFFGAVMEQPQVVGRGIPLERDSATAAIWGRLPIRI